MSGAGGPRLLAPVVFMIIAIVLVLRLALWTVALLAMLGFAIALALRALWPRVTAPN